MKSTQTEVTKKASAAFLVIFHVKQKLPGCLKALSLLYKLDIVLSLYLGCLGKEKMQCVTHLCSRLSRETRVLRSGRSYREPGKVSVCCTAIFRDFCQHIAAEEETVIPIM